MVRLERLPGLDDGGRVMGEAADMARHLVRAMHHWNCMRSSMAQASPRMDYDCWFPVGESLAKIASGIQAQFDREELEAKGGE